MRFHVVLLPLLAGVFACGGGSAPSPSPTAPTPKTEASDAGSAPSANATTGAVDAAALEKLTAEEAKSGVCDGEHKAALEKFIDDVEANVRAKSDDGKPITIESFTKRVLSLSDAAKGIQLTLSGKGTQVHVIAFSSKAVSLDALVGTQAATTMRSPYQRDVSPGPAKIMLPKVGGAVPVELETDSRQIEMKPGASLDVRMRGHGCAGVVVFSKS